MSLQISKHEHSLFLQKSFYFNFADLFRRMARDGCQQYIYWWRHGIFNIRCGWVFLDVYHNNILPRKLRKPHIRDRNHKNYQLWRWKFISGFSVFYIHMPLIAHVHTDYFSAEIQNLKWAGKSVNKKILRNAPKPWWQITLLIFVGRVFFSGTLTLIYNNTIGLWVPKEEGISVDVEYRWRWRQQFIFTNYEVRFWSLWNVSASFIVWK